MKAVIDTNVIVSGLLNPYGHPGEVVRLIASMEFRVCYNSAILSEYREVLLRERFRFDPVAINSIVSFIQSEGLLISGKPLPESLPDRNDDMFLSVALAAKVDCLITGNIKHFPIKYRQGMKILSPSKFIDLIRK